MTLLVSLIRLGSSWLETEPLQVRMGWFFSGVCARIGTGEDVFPLRPKPQTRLELASGFKESSSLWQKSISPHFTTHSDSWEGLPVQEPQMEEQGPGVCSNCNWVGQEQSGKSCGSAQEFPFMIVTVSMSTQIRGQRKLETKLLLLAFIKSTLYG